MQPAVPAAAAPTLTRQRSDVELVQAAAQAAAWAVQAAQPEPAQPEAAVQLAVDGTGLASRARSRVDPNAVAVYDPPRTPRESTPPRQSTTPLRGRPPSPYCPSPLDFGGARSPSWSVRGSFTSRDPSRDYSWLDKSSPNASTRPVTPRR